MPLNGRSARSLPKVCATRCASKTSICFEALTPRTI